MSDWYGRVGIAWDCYAIGRVTKQRLFIPDLLLLAKTLTSGAIITICPSNQKVTITNCHWSLVNNITSRLCHVDFVIMSSSCTVFSVLWFVFILSMSDFLLLARLMGQSCFAGCLLSSVVVCNATVTHQGAACDAAGVHFGSKKGGNHNIICYSWFFVVDCTLFSCVDAYCSVTHVNLWSLLFSVTTNSLFFFFFFNEWTAIYPKRPRPVKFF